MSETRAKYLVSGRHAGDLRDEIRLPFSDPEYQPPTWEDMRALMLLQGWTGSDVALITGVQGRTVRKWASPPNTSNHTQIPYAAWRLLLLEARLASSQEANS